MEEHVGTEGQADDIHSDLSSVFRDLTVQQLYQGARFRGDIEQDFELDQLGLEDDDSDDDETWKLGPDYEKREKPANLHNPPVLDELLQNSVNLTEDGGVRKVVLQKGTGVKPPAGSRLHFNYVGFLAETLVKFDSSTKNGGRGLHVILEEDDCGLIKGFKIGLRTMEMHEVAQILLQPDYAFGFIGCPPRIPPNCPIIFQVRLVDFITSDLLDDPAYMTPSELKNLEFPKLYVAAKAARERGSVEYERNNFAKAVRGYRKAIDMLENYWKVTDEQDIERSEFLACCYCNLAQAYLHLEKGPQACAACKLGLKQHSHGKYRGKLLFRFARAKLLVDSFADARRILKEALDAGVPKTDCEKVEKMIREAETSSKDADKELAKLMLGFPKK